MSIILKLFTKNNQIVSKIFVIAFKSNAYYGVSSALGELGRRFESCRPDS